MILGMIHTATKSLRIDTGTCIFEVLELAIVEKLRGSSSEVILM